MDLNEILKDAKTVLIVSSRPLDYDCLSSNLVVRKYLQSIGKEVKSMFPKTFSEQERKYYEGLPFLEEIEATDSFDLLDKKQFDALVLVDGPNIVQFYDKDTHTDRAPNISVYDIRIHIDHHAMLPENLGTHVLQKSEASSTMEIILNELVPEHFITIEIAQLAMAGIISDTGNFQWKYSPQTYRTAALLVEKGADPQVYIEKIFSGKSKKHFELLSYAIEHVRYDEALGSTFLLLPNEEIQKRGFSEDDLKILKVAYLESFARRIPEYPRGFMLTEKVKGTTGIDARGSNLNNRINLPAMFQKIGGNGGGHFHASGASVTGEFKVIEQELQNIIESELKVLKK